MLSPTPSKFFDGTPASVLVSSGALQGTMTNLDATGSTSSVTDAGSFVLAETALDMHCWGENPVVVAKLQLNGQDRFSEREGSYFDVVQPFQHHSHTLTVVSTYTPSLFALKNTNLLEACNFSRIDNATLQLVLSNNAIANTDTAKVRVYATNYNVLRVMSGMGGLPTVTKLIKRFQNAFDDI